MKKRTFQFIVFSLFCTIIHPSDRLHAGPVDRPAIGIIIDDIGYRKDDDMRALALPGAVTYAIMPHSPHANSLSKLVTSTGRDVILHLPMEAIERGKNRLLGPGALRLGMNQAEFMTTLHDSLRSVPNIIGVNNHMGSLLTMHKGHMEWLMNYLRTQNIFYVDSVTSPYSVAVLVARNKKVPYLRRDIFLDNLRDREVIDQQFNKLIELARRKGYALAIGHPHPETMDILETNLRRLDEYGVRLTGLQELLDLQLGGPQRKVSLH